METFGSLYEESVVPSISYTLGKVSNALQDRREVKVKPRGGNTYSPTGARTIEFTITDSSSYMLWNTLKFQCKMRNKSAQPGAADVPNNANDSGLDLEFLGPVPNVCFQSAKLSIAGQTVELIENYAKSYVALDSLLPQASRVMNGAESLPLISDGASSAVRTLPRLQPTADTNLAEGDIPVGGVVIPVVNANQAMLNADQASQQPDDMDYRRAILMADKYRPISGKKG